MNVLLIDNDKLFKKSLEVALKKYSKINHVISANDLSTSVKLIKDFKIDIVLIDINLNCNGNRNELILSRNILEILPNTKIICITRYDLPKYQNKAKEIGIKGFISKSININKFIDILIYIKNGNIYFPNTKTKIEQLTNCESKILQYLCKGYKRKDIAKILYISERTVSNHIQNIFEKLNVNSTILAVIKSIKLGYINIADIDLV